MAQHNKTCQFCGELGHSKTYCKKRPRTPIVRTSVKKTSKPKKTKTPRAKAKDKAWAAFSIFIRIRDCLRFTGDSTEGMCVTCKALKPFKELQAGHFVGGRGNAVLFREDIVYSQCGYCNQKPPTGLGGNYAAYALFMMDEGYTREEIEELLKLRHDTSVKYKEYQFLEIEEEYKRKTRELLNGK